MVKHVTSKELEEIIQTETRPIFCDFWAAWCGPCRMLAPVFETIANKYEKEAVFLKINVDENEEASKKYEITSIPIIITFSHGAALGNHVGFIPEEELDLFVKQSLILFAD